MADVFARSRRSQARHRGRQLGEIPLSTSEIEYLTRVDESALRRQRLLQVREQEKRAAQLVTQRYRENLKKLQGYRMKYAQEDHRHNQDVLLSALHEKYQFSLQGMGTAQRNAREKVMELVDLAQIEQRKWADNRRGEKARFDDAVDAVHEDTTARLARHREVEHNLQRLKEMSTRQRSEASTRAKRELDIQLQLQRAQEEAQRYRLRRAESEEFSFPRKTQRDVTAYQFTRAHCVTLPTHSDGETKKISTGAGPDGYKEVKVIRHNRVQRHAASAIDQAETYRQEMERKREEDWRLHEENARVAVSRGQEAIQVVEAVRGGEHALDWLASMDRQERTDTTHQMDPCHVDVPVLDGDGSEAFARMFGIEDTSDLIGMLGTDGEQLGPQRVAARRVGSIDDSDYSLLFGVEGQFVPAQDGAHHRDQLLGPQSAAERTIEQKLETMDHLLKRVASYGHANAKSMNNGDGKRAEDDARSRRSRLEEWKSTEAEEIENPAHSFASHSSGKEDGAIQPTWAGGFIGKLSKRGFDQDASAGIPALRISPVPPYSPDSVHRGSTRHIDHHKQCDGNANNVEVREHTVRDGVCSRESSARASEVEEEQATADDELSLAAKKSQRPAFQGEEATQKARRLSLEQLEMQLNERAQELTFPISCDAASQAGRTNDDRWVSDGRFRQSMRDPERAESKVLFDHVLAVEDRRSSGTDVHNTSSEMLQNDEERFSSRYQRRRQTTEPRVRATQVSRDVPTSLAPPSSTRIAVNRHAPTAPPSSSILRTSSNRSLSSSESKRSQDQVDTDSETVREGLGRVSAKSGTPSQFFENADRMGRVRATIRRPLDVEVTAKLQPNNDVEGRSAGEDRFHHSSGIGLRTSEERRAHEAKFATRDGPGIPVYHDEEIDACRHRADARRSTTAGLADALHSPSLNVSASEEGYDDDLDQSVDGDDSRVVVSTDTHQSQFETGSASGDDMGASMSRTPRANSPVPALNATSEADDYDASSSVSDDMLQANGTAYLRQMGREQQSMAGSSSSVLQYSLPLSDSFSSMSDSHLGLDNESLTNQLVPIFPSHNRVSNEDAEINARDGHRSSSAGATGETTILIEGLSPQEAQTELPQRHQILSGSETQVGSVEVGSALHEMGTGAVGEVPDHDKLGLHETDDGAGGDRGDSMEARIRRIQDQSFSSDSSSQSSAYMYLERMQKMTGYSNMSKGAPQPKNRSLVSSSSDDGSSRVNATQAIVMQNKSRAQSSRPSALRRDSVSSSSSSTPSMDARFQYLINMTAVAGKALPLHLNLPSDYSSQSNMRLPPPVDLRIYSSDSESDASGGKNQARHTRNAGKREDTSETHRKQSKEEGFDAIIQRRVSNIPPNPFGTVDFSIPPTLMFRSSSSANFDIDGEASDVPDEPSGNRPAPQFNVEDLGHRLASLPPPPFRDFDMSQPPPPLLWIGSDDESDDDNTAATGAADVLATEFESPVHNTAHKKAASVTSQRKGEVLFVPFESSEQRTTPSPASPQGVSLADAFHARHPCFHRRAESIKTLLEQRREQLEQRRAAESQHDELAQSRGSGRAQSATSSRVKAPASSAGASPQSPALAMPKPELLDRLAAGQRVKISDEEMRERTRRLYNQLPEVTERKRQEDVLERRRQRLTELREREKTRRQQQRERQNRA